MFGCRFIVFMSGGNIRMVFGLDLVRCCQFNNRTSLSISESKFPVYEGYEVTPGDKNKDSRKK